MLRSEAFRLVRNRSRAMNDSTREISPLRQRMLEDMRLRKLAPKTQVAYIRSVRRLAGCEFAALKKRYWGQHLWARGYWVASSGNVTDEVWKKYIEDQKPEEPDDNFKIV
jgi:REP element-mobilizing transposase RayT